MLKVAELLGLPQRDGLFGLEQEVEFHRAPDLMPPNLVENWTTHTDNSLRYYGVEYVTRGPLKKTDVKKHLGELIAYLLIKNKGNTIVDSPRTSFHVHRNVGHLTPLQVWTAVMVYWLVEDVLLKTCGPLREGNLFCLRLRDANYLLDMCRTDVLGLSGFRSLSGNAVRYAACNLSAIAKYGSLEFRAMCGHPHLSNYMKWIERIDSIFQFAEKFETPAAVFEHLMNDVGAERFLTEIFGKEILSEVKDAPAMVESASELVVHFAYCVSDWKAWLSQPISAAASKKLTRARQWNDVPAVARELERLHARNTTILIEDDVPVPTPRDGD